MKVDTVKCFKPARAHDKGLLWAPMSPNVA